MPDNESFTSHPKHIIGWIIGMVGPITQRFLAVPKTLHGFLRVHKIFPIILKRSQRVLRRGPRNFLEMLQEVWAPIYSAFHRIVHISFQDFPKEQLAIFIMSQTFLIFSSFKELHEQTCFGSLWNPLIISGTTIERPAKRSVNGKLARNKKKTFEKHFKRK